MGVKAKSSGKTARGRGRPPKSDRHEGQANFTLPKELENRVEDFKIENRLESRGAAYRRLIEMGLQLADEQE